MNRTQKNNILMIVGFLILSLALFGYQNFFMPAQQQARRAVVYVAGQDLSSDTMINTSEGQFTAVQVSDDSVLPGSVSNLDDVNGQFIEGGLLKGELLTQSRLVSEDEESGNLYVKVEPDFPVDIRDGENVQVFIQGIDEGSGEQVVVSLYKQKKVYSSSRVTNLLEGDSAQGYYLRMSEEELKDYYMAKSRGAIILAKISPTAQDVTETLTTKDATLYDLTEKTEDDATDTEKADETEVESDEEMVRFEVRDGDSLESIADDLELPIEALREVNPDSQDIEAGQFINVPAVVDNQ